MKQACYTSFLIGNLVPVGGTSGWQAMHLYSGYRYKTIAIHACFNNLAHADYHTHDPGSNSMDRIRQGSVAVCL